MFLYYYHHPHHHPLESEPEPESKPKFAPSLRVCWFLMPLGLQLQLHCLRPPPPPSRHPLRPVLHSGQTSFLAPLTGAPLPRRFGWTRRGSNIWQPRSDVAKNRTTLPPAPTTPPAPAPPPTPTASIPIQPAIHSFIHAWVPGTAATPPPNGVLCAARNVQKSPDWFACPFDIGRETGFWDLASRCQPFALFINLVSWQAAAAATLSAWSRWIFHPDGMPTLRFGRFPRRQLGQLPIGRPGTFLSFAQCRQGPDFNTHTHTHTYNPGELEKERRPNEFS